MTVKGIAEAPDFLCCAQTVTPKQPQRCEGLICQNTDIRLTRFASSTSEAASQFQGDLMANLWSSAGCIGHFFVLWTLR